MTKDMKKWFGNHIIELGRYSVGKSICLGLYDPKIPEALKEEVGKIEGLGNNLKQHTPISMNAMK